MTRFCSQVQSRHWVTFICSYIEFPRYLYPDLIHPNFGNTKIILKQRSEEENHLSLRRIRMQTHRTSVSAGTRKEEGNIKQSNLSEAGCGDTVQFGMLDLGELVCKPETLSQHNSTVVSFSQQICLARTVKGVSSGKRKNMQVKSLDLQREHINGKIKSFLN